MSGKVRSPLFLMVAWMLVAGVASGAAPTDYSRLADEGLQILASYLRVDTSNPPGNEIEAARLLEKHLVRHGIPVRVFEPAPKRANLVATLKGRGEKPAILLLQHMDVVPAVDGWRYEPFSGLRQDGSIWGRGALDMKGLGIVHLMTVLELKRSGLPLERDVILVACGDEEMGGQLGLVWLLDNYPEIFENVDFVITEGGVNVFRNGQGYVGIETLQKKPLWLRLRVRGVQGHTALMVRENAISRLVRALNRVLDMRQSVVVDPAVQGFFSRVAPFQPEAVRKVLTDIGAAVLDPAFDPGKLGEFYAALLVDTITVTNLKAGVAVNTQAPEASAELDCRLLPGTDPEVFLKSVSDAIDDPAVIVEVLLDAESARSSENPELNRAIEKAFQEQGVTITVGSAVSPGFTDARHFRTRGIPAYGFVPFRLDQDGGRGVHGRDERLGQDDFRNGLAFFLRVIECLAGPDQDSRPPREVRPKGVGR